MSDDVESVDGDRLRAALVEFARALRSAGANVAANAAFPAAEALVEVGLQDRARVRAALKASLVSDVEDEVPFERLFPQFWRRLSVLVEEEPLDSGDEHTSMEPMSVAAGDEQVPENEDGEPPDPESGKASASREQAATDADSTQLTAGEYSPVGESKQVEENDGFPTESVEGAVTRLTRALATVGGRRWTPASSGSRVHVRRALRQSHSGAALPLPEQERAETAVRGVVLVDVSQSVLDTVPPDFLLRFLQAVHEEWRSLRVFFFDTDVQDVSAAFDTAAGDIYGALERAQAAWGGGTQIGSALTTIRTEYPHAVDRRTVVFVVSDGLERGDVAELEAGMTWLSGRAPLVLWLNPLAASTEFEPATRGMQAALPYLDGLFAFTDASDVDELARQLERQTPPNLGYEYDPRRR